MGKLPNIHAGEVLLEEFLKPLKLSQNRIAREIGVPPRRINEIILGKRGVSADTLKVTIGITCRIHQCISTRPRGDVGIVRINVCRANFPSDYRLLRSLTELPSMSHTH